MKPISIEVVSNVLTMFTSCSRCTLLFQETGVEEDVNKEVFKEYPADLREEFLKLSDLLRELQKLYKHRIRVNLIDAKSPLGIYKSLVHRFRKYPTFIIEKKDVLTGLDRQKLEELLDAHVKTR